MIVTAIAYVFTPLTAAGEEGQPISFVWNVRYLAPAVAVGLAILPCLPALRATPRRRAAVARRRSRCCSRSRSARWCSGSRATPRAPWRPPCWWSPCARSLWVLRSRGVLGPAGSQARPGGAGGGRPRARRVAAGYARAGPLPHPPLRGHRPGPGPRRRAALVARRARRPDRRRRHPRRVHAVPLLRHRPLEPGAVARRPRPARRLPADPRLPPVAARRSMPAATRTSSPPSTPTCRATMRNSPEGRWTQSDPNARVVLRDGPVQGVRASRAARPRRLRGPEAADPSPAPQRAQPQRDAATRATERPRGRRPAQVGCRDARRLRLGGRDPARLAGAGPGAPAPARAHRGDLAGGRGRLRGADRRRAPADPAAGQGGDRGGPGRRRARGLAVPPVAHPRNPAANGSRRAPGGDRRGRWRRPRCRSSSTSATAPSGRASTPTTRARSSTGPTGSRTGSAPSRRPSGSATRPGPRRWPRPPPRPPTRSLLDAFNGLLLAIPVLTALAALAALDRLPAGPPRGRRLARRPALPGRLLPRPERLQGDGDGPAGARLRGGARASSGGEPPPGDRPASPAPGDARGADPARGRERLRLQPPGPGLVRDRRARSGWRSSSAPGGCASTSPSCAPRRAPPPAGRSSPWRWSWSRWGRFSAAQLSGFVGKVGTVQASAGRLSSPVFPGEALGIWPEGDFRVVRGEVERRLPGGGAGAAGGGDRRPGGGPPPRLRAWWRWGPRP